MRWLAAGTAADGADRRSDRTGRDPRRAGRGRVCAPRSCPTCWSRRGASSTPSSPAGTAAASAASARISGSSGPMSRATPMARIDWRRSARDDHTYVRDREWEAAHTVWLWADPSPSMLYKSDGATGLQGVARAGADPGAGRAPVAQRRAHRLAGADRPVHRPQRRRAARLASGPRRSTCRPGRTSSDIRRFSDIVIASDFLDPVEETDGLARRAGAARRARPSDRSGGPGRGDLPLCRPHRIPRPGDRREADRRPRRDCCATTIATLYAARREELAAWCKRLGWSYTRQPHRPACLRGAGPRAHGA